MSDRYLRIAGYSRQHPRPGSPRASGSRSLRLLRLAEDSMKCSRRSADGPGKERIDANPLVARGTAASWRIPSVPGPERERQQRVDFVEEPLCQAAAVSVRGGGQPSKDGPLRLMWRRSAPGGGSASPISANSGRWRQIGTRLSPHSDPADAIGQVLGCA